MPTASAFLSHNSADKFLVLATANQLCRRGIIPWYDDHELVVGVSLSKALKEAIEQQAVLLLFLSKDSVQSDWVKREIQTAFDEEDEGKTGAILPVFIGDPKALIDAIPQLQDRWLSPDHQLVDPLGICVDLTVTDLNAAAKSIADKAAKAIYQRIGCHRSREAVIVVDQRGDEERVGAYLNLPKNIRDAQLPTLIFRPDTGKRSRSETLIGAEWESFAQDLTTSLSKAIGGRNRGRIKKVYILGDFQLGISVLLGRHFDRTLGIEVVAKNQHPRYPTTFSNIGWDALSPLTSGPAALPYLDTYLSVKGPALALFIGNPDFGREAQGHAASAALPFVGIETGIFGKGEQEKVTRLVKEVMSLLAQYRREHGLRDVYLYTSLPWNVLLLLAAYFVHVAKLRFVDRDRNTELYHLLELPESLS